MAFKVPLPVVKKPGAPTTLTATHYANLGIPVVNKSDMSDLAMIGQGSFGRVFKAFNKLTNQTLVMKEITDSSESGRRLLVKECTLLQKVNGHENFVSLIGYSPTDNAIFLEFISFSFAELGIEHEPVSTLRQFLSVCDEVSNSFSGLDHVQYYICADLLCGVAYLHSNNIVHRDLKPENVLVSNKHYTMTPCSDVTFYWTHKPTCVKLSDFGESRSAMVQTQSIVCTSTRNLRRGSPAYLSPEILLESRNTASLADLMCIDLWALGMTVYCIINPDTRYPYANELEADHCTGRMDKLCSLMATRQLPVHSKLYAGLQATKWVPATVLFESCCQFEVHNRLPVSKLLSNFINSYVVVQPLSTHQDMLHEYTVSQGKQTVNACAFLSVLIAERMQKLSNENSDLDIGKVVTSCITKFPPRVNAVRDVEKMYSVDEAYSLLRSCNVIDSCQLEVVLTSTGSKNIDLAQDELVHKLAELSEKFEDFYTTYTCPPYVLLICKLRSQKNLLLIDTHVVSPRFSGENTGVIVTAAFDEQPVSALSRWLFTRMGCKHVVTHELTLVTIDALTMGNTGLTPVKGKPKHLGFVHTFQALTGNRQALIHCTSKTSYNGRGMYYVYVDMSSARGLVTDVESHVELLAESSPGKTKRRLASYKTPSIQPDCVGMPGQADYNVSVGACSSTGSTQVPGVSGSVLISRGGALETLSASDEEPHSSDHMSVTQDDDIIEDLEMYASSDSFSYSSYKEDNGYADQMEPVKKNNNRYCNTEFSVDRWADCPCEMVKEIPSNVNGLCKFVLDCDVKEFMRVTKDGRPWTTWHSSSRLGFNGIRRIARCRGSLMCKSDSCPFLKLNGSRNKYHFQTRDGTTRCFTCGSVPERVNCQATKVWEYDRSAKTATVYHAGMHSCAVRKTLKNASKQAIMKAIRSHPGVKPSRLVNNEMTNLMNQEDFRWEDIETIAEQYADMKQVQYIKDQWKRQSNPLGENFEALGLFKRKCSEKDEYLIYKIGNRALDGEPSFVFKSSTHMARLALSMDRSGDDVLSTEYAHIDATHRRCRDFKSLTLWTYHPVMRKLLRLAVMEIEEENTDNLVIFWTVLNKMLNQVSGQTNYLFNPSGFVADEHHANWNSIKKVYGMDAVERTVSCEFHYRQSVQRHAKALGQTSISDEFVRLADTLLTALSVTAFDAACAEMSTFVAEQCTLKDWFKWWIDRRTHIFRAFKPLEAPATNLAEVGHAKLSSVGRQYMSLIETAREDVAGAIRQEKEIRMFDEGLAKGGRGLENYKRKALQYKQQIRQAEAFAEEVETQTEQRTTFVPKTGRHRPPDAKKRKSALVVHKKGSAHQPNSSKRPSPKSAPEKIDHFHITFFGKIKNLKKCYGCGLAFTKKHTKPPHDLILKTFCHRQYKNKEGVNSMSPKRQAVYCHFNLDCARKIEPRMEATDIILHTEVREAVTQIHKQFLMRFGVHS